MAIAIKTAIGFFGATYANVHSRGNSAGMGRAIRDLSDEENERVRQALAELERLDWPKYKTQTARALALGIKQSTLSKVEKGHAGFSWETAARLAALLNRDAHALLGRAPIPQVREYEERYEELAAEAVMTLKDGGAIFTPQDVVTARRAMKNPNPTVEDLMARILKASADRRAAEKGKLIQPTIDTSEDDAPAGLRPKVKSHRKG